jgi:hypothetical protein
LPPAAQHGWPQQQRGLPADPYAAANSNGRVTASHSASYGARQSPSGASQPRSAARQPLPADQHALFLQTAHGRRGGGQPAPHSLKAERRAAAAAAAPAVSSLPGAAAGDYLHAYPAVKSLLQKFKWVLLCVPVFTLGAASAGSALGSRVLAAALQTHGRFVRTSLCTAAGAGLQPSQPLSGKLRPLLAFFPQGAGPGAVSPGGAERVRHAAGAAGGCCCCAGCCAAVEGFDVDLVLQGFWGSIRGPAHVPAAA